MPLLWKDETSSEFSADLKHVTHSFRGIALNKKAITKGTSTLLRLKGVPGNISVKELPFNLNSLNQGDAFLIDIGDKVFQWNGCSANFAETKASTELLKQVLKIRGFHLNDKQALNNLIINSDSTVVDCETTCSIEEQLVLELLPNQYSVCFGLFKRSSRIKTAKKGGKDEKQKVVQPLLFKINLNQQKTKFKFKKCKNVKRVHRTLKRRHSERLKKASLISQADGAKKQSKRGIVNPLKKKQSKRYSEKTFESLGSSSSLFDDLSLTDKNNRNELGQVEMIDSNSLSDDVASSEEESVYQYTCDWLYKRDCLVLDTGFAIFVWIGKKAKLKKENKCKKAIFEKNDNIAVEIMKDYMKLYKKPKTIPWYVIHQGKETEEFNKYFIMAPNV